MNYFSSSTRFLRFHLQSSYYFCKFSTTPIPVTNPIVNHTTVHETLTSFNNDWKRALEFFNWVETGFNYQHSTDNFNLIIDILAKVFEFEQCWNLIHKMSKSPNSKPNHTTFRVMFKRYISARAVDEAVRTFERISDFNLKDETSFSNLIDALCQYKHVIEAQELLFGDKKTLTLNWNLDGVESNTKLCRSTYKIVGVDEIHLNLTFLVEHIHI